MVDDAPTLQPPAARSLIVVDELFGRVFPLHEGVTIIGRSDDCDITVPRGSIGQQHAELVWECGQLTVRDLNSTNGTYILPSDAVEDGSGAVLTVGSTPLRVGDRLLIGGLGRLVVQFASWLADEPPGSFDTSPASPELFEPVLEAARPGGDLSQFSGETLDAAWVAVFLRWRRAPSSQRVFDLGARMCSRGTLITLREALDDPVRWFVDDGLDVVRMLAASSDPIGVPLALNVRLRHASRGFREVAGVAVRTVAQGLGTSITELACARFSELADGSSDPLQLDFAADAIESARKQGIAWPAAEWRRLLTHAAFARAASNFVFVIRERDVLFRPVDGEFLALDGTLSVRDGEQVGVASALDPAWHEHLAEYEVVQPFPH